MKNINAPESVQKLDLSSAKEVRPPEAPGGELKPLQRVGYTFGLWTFVLLAITIAAIFLIILFNHGSLDSSKFVIDHFQELSKDTSNIPINKFLVETVTTESQKVRDFWIQIAQMVLINLLLPILTAILGYIFGKKEE